MWAQREEEAKRLHEEQEWEEHWLQEQQEEEECKGPMDIAETQDK